MKTKKKTTEKTEKKPTDATWADLPTKDRVKLAKEYRRRANNDARQSRVEARRAKKETPGSYWHGVYLRRSRGDAKNAAKSAALADLIERNT